MLKLKQVCSYAQRRSKAIFLKSPNQIKSFSEIPEPDGLPLLGTVLDYTAYRNFSPLYIYEFFKKRHEQLGPIYKEKILPGLSDYVVHISAPCDIETLFRTEEKMPYRPPSEVVYRTRELAGLHQGVVNAQGEDWYRIRKLYNEHLLTNKSIWTYTQKHFEVALDLMDYIEQNLNGDNEVSEFVQILYRWALESTTVFTLDTKLNVFRSNVPKEAEEIIRTTANLFSTWARLMFSPPLWKYFYTKEAKELKKCQDDQFQALQHYIETQTNGLSKMQKMVAESNLSSSEKSVVLTDILGGGVDTTHSAACFLLYCLATNPEKQEILRQEVFDVCNADEQVTGRKLQQMQYLHAVNLEAQRLFPLTIGTKRKTSVDLVLSDYLVPAGTDVFLTANVINNKDSTIFDKPDKFLPERWLDRKFNRENKFVMLGSFGIGSRGCPGRRFALQELGCLVIALLTRFKIEYHHEPFEMVFKVVSRPVQEPRFAFLKLEDDVDECQKQLLAKQKA